MCGQKAYAWFCPEFLPDWVYSQLSEPIINDSPTREKKKYDEPGHRRWYSIPMTIEITFLGTGTSQGIPMIGCDCQVCRSDDPRDTRTRTSVLIEFDNSHILIDATPELRVQCLANDVRRVDACLVTHTHADHIFGLDDLRRFNQLQRGPIHILAARRHMISLIKVFGYARAVAGNTNHDLPQFVFQEFMPGGSFSLFGREIRTFELPHGSGTVTGYRIGPVAYCTDLHDMPDKTVAALQGLEVMVLGALRPHPGPIPPKHLTIEEAVELARRIGARRTCFVHMAHRVMHREVEAFLPPGISLAYDGLKVRVEE